MHERPYEKEYEISSSQMVFSIVEVNEDAIALKFVSKCRGKYVIICSYC